VNKKVGSTSGLLFMACTFGFGGGSFWNHDRSWRRIYSGASFVVDIPRQKLRNHYQYFTGSSFSKFFVRFL